MNKVIPPALQPWMEDSGSFMRRARLSGFDPQIQVLKESWQDPSQEQCLLLSLSSQEKVFSRDVLIHDKKRALLFASSFMPAATLSGGEEQLQYLGERPLGSVLFSYPDMKRSAFEFRLYELPEYSAAPLWGRSSLFHFQGKVLLLNEVFLPGLMGVHEDA